jgi:hypothetical protein
MNKIEIIVQVNLIHLKLILKKKQNKNIVHVHVNNASALN